MREIKFRAWFKKKPDWCNRMFYCEEESKFGELGDWFSECEIENSNGNTVVFMQYTGLEDCKKQKIYEGDILSWDSPGVDGKWIVKAVDGGWNPFIESMQTDGAWHYEVIGNIYENPKLIKEGGSNG